MILIIILIVVLILLKKSKLITRKKSSFDIDYENLDYESFNNSKLNLLEKSSLKEKHFIGKGAFGTVHSGYYTHFADNKQCKINVAIKKLNFCQSINQNDIKKLENKLILVFDKI